MGTKNNPAAFDCYANAEPDEPMFILLGRDRVAAKLVRDWADFRFRRLPNFGMDHPEEIAQIHEAMACAKAMEAFADRRQQEKNHARIAAEKAAMAETERLRAEAARLGLAGVVKVLEKRHEQEAA